MLPNDIFLFNESTQLFEQITPGKLTQVAGGYGIDASGDVFEFSEVTQHFERIQGVKLAQIAEGWGINASGDIFEIDVNNKFVQVPGNL